MTQNTEYLFLKLINAICINYIILQFSVCLLLFYHLYRLTDLLLFSLNYLNNNDINNNTLPIIGTKLLETF